MTEVVSVKVHIPSSLRAYTNQAIIAANGATLADVFDDLERRYPGIRFRVINEQAEIREHIKIFVNQQIAPDLQARLAPNDQVRIIMAISGG